MDDSEKRYYKINEVLMSCIGQWPYQTKMARRFFQTILFTLCASQIIPQILAIIKYSRDPEIFLECVSPLIFILVCMTKLITCIMKKETMGKLLNRIDRDWKIWARDEEVEVLRSYAETGRKMALVYTVAIYSTGLLFITQPIVPKIIDVLFYNGTEPGEFPVPVYYYGVDEQKYYFYIIAYTYVCISMIIIINIAGDTMFIVHVHHCCGIFAALGRKLERVGERTVLENGTDQEYKKLANCIDRHNDAIEEVHIFFDGADGLQPLGWLVLGTLVHNGYNPLLVPTQYWLCWDFNHDRFAKLIETTYSGCFFFVVGFNMMIMSVTALQILTKTNDPQDTIRFIAFVFAQMFHLFIESYISQILIDHSTSIRRFINNGEWYKASVKSQKLLNLVMMRSNLPCKVTAGKICVMSIETFGVVVKTSVSYFTLLRSMQ